MKLRSDDPRLTSYLLGELSPEEMREVERWVEGDPALRLVMEDQRRVLGYLEGVFGTRKMGLSPDQRESVLRAGREADEVNEKVVVVSSWGKERWKSLGTVAAAAAVVLAALGVVGQWNASERSRALVESERRETEIALLPMPGPVWEKGEGGTVVASAAAALVAERDRRLVDDSTGFLEGVAERVGRQGEVVPDHLPATVSSQGQWHVGEIRLPVFVGTNSLSWVRSSLVRERKLPRRDAVRLEEWVGAFPLGEAGVVEVESGVRVWAREAPCVWDRERKLVALQIQGAPSEALPVEWFYRTAGEEVRVLSSVGAGVSGDGSGSVGRLPAGRKTLVVMLVRGEADVARQVRVVVDGKAEEVAVGAAEEGELDLVQVVAATGLWMRGEGISREQVVEIAGLLKGRMEPVAKEATELVARAIEVSAPRR